MGERLVDSRSVGRSIDMQTGKEKNGSIGGRGTIQRRRKGDDHAVNVNEINR